MECSSLSKTRFVLQVLACAAAALRRRPQYDNLARRSVSSWCSGRGLMGFCQSKPQATPTLSATPRAKGDPAPKPLRVDPSPRAKPAAQTASKPADGAPPSPTIAHSAQPRLQLQPSFFTAATDRRSERARTLDDIREQRNDIKPLHPDALPPRSPRAL